MVLPLSEVRILDANAEALGVSVASLMDRAGAAVADHVAGAIAQGPVTVVAGPGNNGGDGLVAARLLADRFAVKVVLTFPAADGFRSTLARDAYAALPQTVDVVEVADEAGAAAAIGSKGVIIDAVLGAGVTGRLREPVAGVVRAIKASGLRVFSVDVPTGFGSPDAVVPDCTITFHDVKEGLTPETGGVIVVADIGIPEQAGTHTGPGELTLYPRPRLDQHKGEGGIVLVIGGGPYTGAPAVAGLAALRAGADLAIVLTPQRSWTVIAGYSPNLVVRPLNKDDLDFADPANRVTLNLWLKKADAVVLGPGLGLAETTMRSVQHVVERAGRAETPVILDADAITAVAEKRELLGRHVIVTPHKREFQTLTGRDVPDDPDKRAEVARLAAAEAEATFLLKGPTDVISDGVRVKRNATGHPAMSVGGTGDALAGVVGALAAKGLGHFDAARLGAYLTGLAGERAAVRQGHGLMATDVVEALGEALTERVPAPGRS